MKKESYHVLGIMSGTSLDGIDLAEIYFNIQNERWHFEFGVTQTIPYSQKWGTILKEAINFSEGRLQPLNEEYTQFLGETILKFITNHNIKNLDAVCSHGHTILHQPENGITLQIGNLAQLAKIIQQTVVCDFRVQDVALGGQGAPLVPIGDRLLFGEFDFCLNLGGFANCSFERNGQRIAYDICPVNIVLNHYAEKLGKPFDASGDIAASGKVNKSLLLQLNSLPFYAEIAPKSLGLEWVQKHILPLLDASKDTSENILRTFVEHVAIQLSLQFENVSTNKNASVLITGGGAYNDFLISRLKTMANLSVNIPSKNLIEYKEALIFGLLGVLKLRDETNCLASVTGAVKNHSSGNVFHA